MGGCFSVLIIFNKSDNRLPAASTTNIITITGEFRQFVTPISVSQVLEQIDSSSSEFFVCNSDNLYYDEHIPALSSDQELHSGEIYFMLPNSKLRYPLTASEMAALAIKASAALSSNKIRRSRISPVLSLEVDEKVNENSLVSNGIVKMKNKGISSDKQYDVGISRSGSIRKLQRYSSQRVKLAARSFRLKLNTIYEVLGRLNPVYHNMSIRNDLLFEQIMKVNGLGERGKKKRKVKGPGTSASAGASASLPSFDHDRALVEVQDVAESESERQIVPRAKIVLRAGSSGKYKTRVPPSATSGPNSNSAYQASTAFGRPAGIYPNPDGSKVGWLFGNQKEHFLDTAHSGDDLGVLDSLTYSESVRGARYSFGEFTTFLSKVLSDPDVAGAEQEISDVKLQYSEYRRNSEIWKADMQKENADLTLENLEQKTSLTEKGKRVAELDGVVQELKAQLGKVRLENDVITDYKVSDAYSADVTKAAGAIMPKTFKVAKQFLRENPNGVFADFVPKFFDAPDDIEDEDEYDYED